jgi:sterol desaturase/sphingolipid hydroxylase (fatty acid hydroxylase superfamily)
MNTSLFSVSLEHYEWRLTLYTVAAILAILIVGRYFLYLLPGLRQTKQLNRTTAKERMSRDFYVRIQRRSGLWGLLFQLAYVVLVLPFVLTAEARPWWRMLFDIFAILMVYDFVYYLTHRFLFHAGPLGGPLMWMHAVHHQQKNPCRLDSNYLHPLETCIGLALYGGTVAFLAALMGGFQVVTIVATYVLFLEINQHNHDLTEIDRFPFKYFHRAAYMHHVHHARFTGGNFGTISLLYDWLFGTYDTGGGWGKNEQESR